MPHFLDHRRREAEWMDRPDADPDELRRSLGYIRWINSVLGYTRATLWHLEQFSKQWKPGERIEIVDLATGSADIPLAILDWGKRRGFDVHVTGVDLHPTTAAEALAAGKNHPNLRIVQADVLAMPFAEGSFDYAITAMFLHHLDDGDVTKVLATMNRLARRGVIVADLLRNRRAYTWIKLLTLFSNPMVKHDAVVSVGQAFTAQEIMSLAQTAGLGYVKYRKHFGHRFVLAGEKPQSLQS